MGKRERRWRFLKARIDEEKCKGCGLCIAACPKKIIARRDKLNRAGYLPAVIGTPEACVGCKLCAISCPDVAITVE